MSHTENQVKKSRHLNQSFQAIFPWQTTYIFLKTQVDFAWSGLEIPVNLPLLQQGPLMLLITAGSHCLMMLADWKEPFESWACWVIWPVVHSSAVYNQINITFLLHWQFNAAITDLPRIVNVCTRFRNELCLICLIYLSFFFCSCGIQALIFGCSCPKESLCLHCLQTLAQLPKGCQLLLFTLVFSISKQYP